MDSVLVSRITNVISGTARIDQQLAYEAQGIVRLQAKITQLEEEKTQLVKAVGLIDRCIQLISANGVGKIESIVTGGLRLVFNDPHMGLIVEKKEGARGITYQLQVRKGTVTGDPMKFFGGGVVNVVAFLLRVIMIKRFKLAKFLVVDENFNNVSPDYQPRVSEMLHKLCADHGYTILAVTHQPILASAADAVYEVSVGEGKTPVLRKLEAPELEELKVIDGSANEAGQA
jgi:DNA repair ATPase RecN